MHKHKKAAVFLLTLFFFSVVINMVTAIPLAEARGGTLTKVFGAASKGTIATKSYKTARPSGLGAGSFARPSSNVSTNTGIGAGSFAQAGSAASHTAAHGQGSLAKTWVTPKPAPVINAPKKTTQSGIGVTQHSVQQKINRQVRSADELDAIKNPLDVRPIKLDKLGRPSQRSIGRKAEVARNPETGNIISVNPTSTKKAERLLRRLEGQ